MNALCRVGTGSWFLVWAREGSFLLPGEKGLVWSCAVTHLFRSHSLWVPEIQMYSFQRA
jgi:hypothetical protein